MLMWLMLSAGLGVAQEASEWSVDAPPGPSQTLELQLTEGTWMNVDVSPDGRSLVFDLLGDLYLMPRNGGTPEKLTEGMAWDMQPAFSPDGKSLVFTSDRAGGDNLWIMDLESRDVTQVTKESFRLLSSPDWHPSGRFVVGRKHFTGSRSLGSGEMWLYPLDGGPGLQLTKKPNEQQDVGEPVYGPDGTLYYSRDATPGPTFQYNKDPNSGIYRIEALDTDGHLTTIARGAGGASRPTPSPDGKTLAYVRRHREATELVLLNLASGVERVLASDLDKDQQESWAIHGTYPHMSWLPDGSGVVYWAGGVFHEVSLGGESTTIAFDMKDTREIREAIRFPVEVAPDEVDVKAMRWVSVSPDGNWVVFEALGRLWTQPLSGGTPKPITTEEEIALDPSFSPDSKSIVFASWSDTELGTVRKVSVKGGRAKVLVGEPGHYRRPILAQDGTLAYERVRGGRVTARAWSNDTGVWIKPVKGESYLLQSYGTALRFTPDGLLWFMDGYEPMTLSTIDLKTREVVERASGDKVTAFAVSPEGDRIMFQEGFDIYEVERPAVGSVVNVSEGMSSLAVKKLSDDSGFSPHYAGGHAWWSLGSTLGNETDTRIELDLEVPADAPQGVGAVVGAKIITMNGDEVIEEGTIVWENNRIVAVGPSASVTVPDGAFVVDGAGKSVIPGLVDVHAHGAQGEDGLVPQQNWSAQAHLAFGVTTIHDPSHDTRQIFAASERQRVGTLLAPRTFSTGTILYGATASGVTATIDSQEDAERHLKRLKAYGAFSVKSYNQPRRDQRQQVLAAARKLEMMVVPEGGSTYMHNMNQVVDGHTGIEHSIPVAPLYSDVVQLWAGTEVGYTPTLGVSYGGLMGENYWYAKTNVWEHPLLQQYVPWWVLDPASRRATRVPDDEYHHVTVAASAHKLWEAGVSVQVGAHGQREGLASHWEMWMMEQGGFTPHQALQAGTLQGAKYLGLDGDIGSLQVGKLADLVLIEGDVLQDLSLSDEVSKVILNGRVYTAEDLSQEWPKVESQPTLWWEGAGAGEWAPPTCGCGRH